jgi:hypothetical protein
VGDARMSTRARPAFYALAPGGWRDYVTLLHPPYTAWHLSYVAMGAALAPVVSWDRLLLGLLAFFLATGVGAHALDELRGRPLRTRIPKRALWGLAAASIATAVGLGVYACIAYTPWLAPCVAFGAFIVVAYNLELFGGRFHTDAWFALAWGGFPALTGYLGEAERLSAEALVLAAFAALLSAAQRALSNPVRDVRRRVASVAGTVELADGRREPLGSRSLTDAPEAALRLLSVASVVLAVALLVRAA